MTKEESFALLDAFHAAGGNFIDTANNYQDEESETWLGEWMASRKIRDEIVIATKFTTNYRTYAVKDNEQNATSYGGNGPKSLKLSLRDSLRKLQTDYIDILYVHWWDYSSSIPELMRSLDALVRAGTVLHLGISDTPAWVVAKANQYARDHALAEFVIYQGKWNVIERDFEREIIPMVRDDGMALAPWGALGSGKFQTKAQVEERKSNNESLRWTSGQSPQEEKISAALEQVSKELSKSGAGEYSVTAIALAYVLQRTPYVFPIIGGRKVSQLNDNIKALEINLSDAQIQFLESQTEFNLGFPGNFIGEDPRRTGETQCPLMKNSANLKWVKEERAIPGAKM